MIQKIKLLTMFRLGLFQMGLGIMSLLTLGVLNRIMIDELKVLPFLAAGAIAPNQPHSHYPLNDTRNMNHPSRD